MTITTHDLQTAGLVVEWGHEPKPDKEAVAAYNKRRAESARRVKAERAAPTGPRSDEWEGTEKPVAITQGAVNPEAVGCVPVDWKPPVGGRWVPGPNGVERFVPDPAPAFTPVPRTVHAPASVKPKEIEGTLVGTSAIGAKPKNKYAAPPCGPAPIAWRDPAETKGNQ
jgi:hypothetical protein